MQQQGSRTPRHRKKKHTSGRGSVGKRLVNYLKRLMRIGKAKKEVKTIPSMGEPSRTVLNQPSQDSSALQRKVESARTWRVGADSSCEFSNIQDAVDRANSGDTVAIGPGIYVGSIKINKDLVLIGAGDGRSNHQARPAATRPAVTGAPVPGGPMVAGGGDGGPPTVVKATSGPAIWVAGGNVKISQMRVMGGKGMRQPLLGDGIRIDNEAKVNLTRVVAEQNERAGIRVRASAEADIRSCEVTVNGSCGIVVTRGAFVTITETGIHHNEKAGVALSGGMERTCGKESTVSSCDITENNGYGVMIEDNPPVVLHHVCVERNAKHGVIAWNHARFRLMQSKITKNGGHGVFFATFPPGNPVGVKYPPRIEATIADNSVAGNSGAGFAVGYEATSEVYPYLPHPVADTAGIPEITLLLEGQGNVIPDGSSDENHGGALIPPYPGKPWPDGFLSELEKSDSVNNVNKKIEKRQGSPIRNAVHLEGVTIPITDRVADYCKDVLNGQSSALQLDTLRFSETYREVMSILESKRDKGFAARIMTQDSSLMCASCHFRFPGSFQISLIFGGKSPLAGTVGACPKCGSKQALFVTDIIAPETIDDADVAALRALWEFQAQRWWKIDKLEPSPEGVLDLRLSGPPASRAEATCDHCSAPIPNGSGYLFGTRLLCRRCADELLADAKKELRANPHCYGWGELRRARALQRQRQED